MTDLSYPTDPQLYSRLKHIHAGFPDDLGETYCISFLQIKETQHDTYDSVETIILYIGQL